MGDIKVIASEDPVFRRNQMERMVSVRSYGKFTNSRKSVVRHAVVKLNTDPDPNDSEDDIEEINVSTTSPTNDTSAEANDKLGAIKEEETTDATGNAWSCQLATEDSAVADEADEMDRPSVSSINGSLKEASGTCETIKEDIITPTEEKTELTLSPMALFHEAADEIDAGVHRFFGNVIHKGSDLVGKFTHSVEGAAKLTFYKKRISIEGPPENNIHLIYRPNQQMIHMGIHIEQHDEGCRIARVIKDSIACRSRLQENDVIRKINGFDLSCKRIGDIISHFSKIDITETFTLTITRKIESDDGNIELIDIDVHITITLSENNIDFEVEFQVTSQKLKFQSLAENKYIAQVPTGRSTVYLRVNGKDARMDTKTDHKAVFDIELYQGGSHRVCVIRNQPSQQVIDKHNGNNKNELRATNAPSPGNQPVSSQDTKFFYWRSHPNYPNEDVFESVNMKGYYMTSTTNNTVVLKKFNSINSVTANGFFRIIDVN